MTEVLSSASIALDLESYDPGLTTLGPGFLRDTGYPVGVSLAWWVEGEPKSCYLPIAHEGGGNLPRAAVLSFLKDLLHTYDRYIMYANAQYDIGWLRILGIVPRGTPFDIIVAEGLLDEEREDGYGLDAISKDYLGQGKDEALLRELSSFYGIDPKKDLWKLAGDQVAEYAAKDAEITLVVGKMQAKRLQAENLIPLFKIEAKITNICHKMSWKGVRVDLSRADELNARLLKEEKEIQKELGSIDIWSTAQCARMLESKGVQVEMTMKGNPSVPKDFLTHCEDPYAQKLNYIRQINRCRKVFIEDGILRGHRRGRIHCQFLQSTREEGGTRSGRFSCKTPNLQQVPSRSKIGKEIRSLYIPEEGELWAKLDYNSQEPRLMVHYSLLHGFDGAQQAAESFRAGKKLYTFLQEKVPGLSYDMAKQLVLALSYRMGLNKLSEKLEMSLQEAKTLVNSFNRYVPFISQLIRRVEAEAERDGEITTILGRKRRFNHWIPADSKGAISPIKGREAAEKHFETKMLKRAYITKALNAKIQGSAADQTKKAMVLADEAGFCPLLQVHDELGSSLRTEEELKTLKEIMENAIPLALPTRVDGELKQHW